MDKSQTKSDAKREKETPILGLNPETSDLSKHKFQQLGILLLNPNNSTKLSNSLRLAKRKTLSDSLRRHSKASSTKLKSMTSV